MLYGIRVVGIEFNDCRVPLIGLREIDGFALQPLAVRPEI